MSLKKNLKLAKQTLTTPKARNPISLNPLLKKGGVHHCDHRATRHKQSRRQSKQALRCGRWE